MGSSYGKLLKPFVHDVEDSLTSRELRNLKRSVPMSELKREYDAIKVSKRLNFGAGDASVPARYRNRYIPPEAPLVGVELNPGPLTKKERRALVATEAGVMKRHMALKPKAERDILYSKRKRGKNGKMRGGFIANRVSAPSNTGFSIGGALPSRSTKNGVTRVIHTEYVRDLISSSTANTFTATGSSLNLANPTLFPWLSTMASLYGEFVPHRIDFHVESLLSTSSAGAVILAVTPDCTDPTPSNKTDMMSLNNRQRSNVWTHCDFSVNKSILTRIPKFVTASADTQTDLDKSVGKFIVASDGLAAGAKYGELYVTYDVSFYDEQPATYITLSSSVNSNTAYWWETATSVAATAAYEKGVSIGAGGESRNGTTDQGWLKVNKGGPGFYAIIYMSGTVVASAPSISIFNNYGVDISSALSTGFSMVNAAGTAAMTLYTYSSAANTVLSSPYYIYDTVGANATVANKYFYLFPASVFSSFPGNSIDPLFSLKSEFQLLKDSVSRMTFQSEPSSPVHVESDVTASYITRIGDALGVQKTLKK